MPRRSGRQSLTWSKPKSQANGAKASSSNGLSKKRDRDDDLYAMPRASKQQRKAEPTKKSPRTSQHFPKQDYSEATGLTSEDSSDHEDEEDESDFGNGGGAATPEEDDDQDEDEIEDESDFSEESEPKRKAKKATPKASKSQNGTPLPSRGKGGDLWREGAALGVEAGTEVIIKKPKARPAGKTPYKEETIHPNTLLFLGELKQNNDREWLKMHDPDFREAEKDFKAFVEVLTQKLIEIDETVPELPVKDIVFRIYRDVRFSKDQTPYKAHFSAAWSRTGRKGPYAAYYLQLAPGDSFLGGGSWFPESQPLSRLRTDIDQHPERFKNVLMQDDLRKEFLGGVPKKVDKVVKAFVSEKLNSGSALKTRPQGYDKDHVDIDLLRLKNFTVGRKLTDEEIVKPEFLDRVASLMTIMQPYIHYLNSIIMPDQAAESSSSEGDEDGSEDIESEGSEEQED